MPTTTVRRHFSRSSRGKRFVVRKHTRESSFRVTVALGTSTALPNRLSDSEKRWLVKHAPAAYVKTKSEPRVIRLSRITELGGAAEERIEPIISHETLHGVIAIRVNPYASVDLDRKHRYVNLMDYTGL
jgi:hypothetical protein